MKKICRLLILVVLSVIGCSKQTEQYVSSYFDSFDADLEEAITKASFNNGSVSWNIKDSIGVVSDIQGPVAFYWNDEGHFVGEGIGGNKFYAYYPYRDSEYDPTDPNVVKVKLAGVFMDGDSVRIPMIAKSSGGTLFFKQTCGLIHIRVLSAEKLKAVVLFGNNGEPINGWGNVDMSEDSPIFKLDLLSSKDSKVEIRVPENKTEGPYDFFFPLPVTILSGFSVDICYLDPVSGEQKVITKSTNNKVEIKRGVIKNYSIINLDSLVEEANSGFASLEEAQNDLEKLYSYFPDYGNVAEDAAMLGGDELWDLDGRRVSNTAARVPNRLFQIALGKQSSSSTYANDWSFIYEGVSQCNYFLRKIKNTTLGSNDMRNQMFGEAAFLKAFFYFHLIKKWGPIPLIPVDSSGMTTEELKHVPRNNIDECFDEVLSLMSSAEQMLSSDNYFHSIKITRTICAAMKAKVAVFAASPLFNGNEEFADLTDDQGNRLFPSKTETEKQTRWAYAVEACGKAIDACKEAQIELYEGEDISYIMPDTLKTTLTLRNAFNLRWNSELIWGNSQTNTSAMSIFQQLTIPNMTQYPHSIGGYRFIGVPLKIVDQFYSHNGLPIRYDKELSILNMQDLKKGTADHRCYIEQYYTTVTQNFNREPRFYAFLGFDGGKWLGELTNYNYLSWDDVLHIECRNGGHEGKTGDEVGPVTGYFAKKLYPLACNFPRTNSFVSYWYPWPVIRLADLYLLYAEAINEAEGPNGEHREELYKYLDAVRLRAGIPDVKTAWDNYSNNPGFYCTQSGMREVIHQERLIELCFEGQRFWDIRRWKTAPSEYKKGIYGYDVSKASPKEYYNKVLIFNQTFGRKDYFWPISQTDLSHNPNLVQNVGW